MTNSLDALVKIEKHQIEAAAHMFSRAFIDDPFVTWVFPNIDTRKELLFHYFKLRIKYGYLFGEVYATSPNIEGLAVWLPSKSLPMTSKRIIRAGWMTLMKKISKTAYEKLSFMGKFTYEIHHKIINYPHWYLAPMGVDPEHQGKGFGSKLIRSMLTRLDEENLPCFLETQNKENVEIYQHFDFEIVEEVIIPETDLTHWAMLRKPH